MAGDWIKMRSDLHTHPKVVRISSALHADRLRVIGGLHAVWCLFDAHSEDGSLDGYTLEAIDELIGWAGFATALQSVGWLVLAGDSVSLPRFDEHNGRSAKRRVMETERKRRERVAETSGNVSASDADKKRTREEKIKEEVCSSLRSEHTQSERSSPGPVSKTTAICFAMRAAGLPTVNPSHPDLAALIERGAEIGMFEQAARQAVEKGKSFAYAIGIVKGQLLDAQNLAKGQHNPPGSYRPTKFDPVAYVNDPAYKEAWDRAKQGAEHGIVIDVATQRLA